MSEPTVNCPNCLRPAQMDASECVGCNSNLLVDVFPADRPADAKSRYQLARSLAAIAGAPPLAALRAALDTEGAPLVAGVTRATAAAFESVLSGYGVVALLQPTSPPVPPRRLKPYVVAAGVLAIIGLGIVQVARTPRAREEVVPTPYPVAMTGRPIRPFVTTRCPGSNPSGAAFFVNPNRLIMAAHLLCNGDGPLIRFSDNREVLSSVLGRNTRFDLAFIEVEITGDFQPIPLGDATTLRTGDRVQIVGGGAETSVRRGRVSSVANEEQGIGWLLVDVGHQPVGDGDAVLDTQGRLVGMLHPPAPNEESARAIPINYGYDPTENGGMPLIWPWPRPPPDEILWRDYLRRVNDDEAMRARRFVEGLERRPGVFESSWFIPGDRVHAALVVRSLEPPQPREMEFDLRMYGASVCSGTLVPNYVYEAKDVNYTSTFLQGRSHLRWNWVTKHNLADHLYVIDFVGKGGPFQPCLAGRSHLVMHVKGAAEDLDAVPLQFDL